MSSSNDYQNFQKDFQNYENNLSEFNALANGNGSDMPGTSVLKNDYKTELNAINWKGTNPWIMLISVMTLILDPGTNMINNTVDLTGEQSKCQTALLKCQNDLSNITNDKGGGKAGLTEEATGLNTMIAALSGQG